MKPNRYLFLSLGLIGFTLGLVISFISMGGSHYELTQPIVTGNVILWTIAGGFLAIYPLVYGLIEIHYGESKKKILLSLFPVLTVFMLPILVVMYFHVSNIVLTTGSILSLISAVSILKFRHERVFRGLNFPIIVVVILAVSATPAYFLSDALGVNSTVMEKETSGGMGIAFNRPSRFCISQIKRNCQAFIGTKDQISVPSECNSRKPSNIPEKYTSEITTLGEKLQSLEDYALIENGSKVECLA